MLRRFHILVLVASAAWLLTPACANPYAVPSCSDDIDNDHDGLTDRDDPDCPSDSSNGEANGARPDMDAGTPDAGQPDAGPPRDADLGDAGPPVEDAGPGFISEDDILGTWEPAAGSADFGRLYLSRRMSGLRAVYEGRNGRIVADYEPGTQTLDGWWSETPGRSGMNAGPCSFVISRGAGGRLHAEGSWARESNPGRVRDDWDLDYVGPDIPPAIEDIFVNNRMSFRDGR